MGVGRAQIVPEDRASGAMQIQGSFQFDKNASEYLNRTPGSGGNRRTWTMSFWMRRTSPGNSSRFISTGYQTSGGVYGFYIGYNSDKFSFVANHDSIGLDLRPSAFMMDTAAWYHCVFALDTTQGTASDRAAIYINGEKVTDFATENYPGQNTDPNWNNTSKTHTIGGWNVNSSMADWFDGYLTQFDFIDGQMLDASYFAYTDPLTNTWRPKKYEGSYGTQGFNLPMDGSGETLGTDQSGNGNDWSLNNITTADVCAQSPSGTSYSGKQRHGGSTTYNASRIPANYCTLDPNNEGGSLTIKNVNTEGDSSGEANIMGTHVIPPNSGKYYWECQVTNTMAGVIGIAEISVANTSTLASNTTIRGYGADGNKYFGSTGASYGSAFSHSGWVSVLFDSDQRTLEFYYNGVSQGVAFTSGRIVPGAYYVPCFHLNSMDLKVNFGANYAYSTTNWATVPPEGYKTLCDASLSQSTGAVIPGKYCAAVIYTGNESVRSFDIGFKPDLIMTKSRSNSGNWYWYDSTRGANYYVKSNSDGNESNDANVLQSFNIDGFTMGSGTPSNQNSWSYIAWCFKAGGGSAAGQFWIDDRKYASAANAKLSVGALTSSTINQTQTWSGLFTLASGSFDQAITNAFDGHISRANQARTSGNAVLITMSLSTPVTVSSSIEVFGERNYGSVCTVTVDGDTYTSSLTDTAGPSRHHIFKVRGSLTQMTLTSLNPPGTGRTYMEGMIIDGKLLVDNGVSIDKPSIAPSAASVGTNQGFSIIKYEGNGSANQTIAHGLGKKPTQIIIKRLDGGSGNTGDWMMGGVGLHSWSYYLVPNKNQAEASDFAPFGPEPTDSVFTVGSSDRVNNDGNDYIAYVWTDIPGVQKFGRYVGNGNTDGAFINTGFKPALLVVKVITSGESERWYMFDNKRNTHNPTYKYVDLGDTMTEQTGYSANLVDFLSNGFKFRNGAGNYWNGAYNYVYMAWAESPQFNLYGGQSNAY